MTVVRRAKPQDSYEFTALVRQFVREAKYPFTVDNDLVFENYNAGIADPNFIFLVAIKDEEVVGFLCGCANSPLFSRDRTAIELGWYLKKEHRDVKTGITLMKEFEKWARSQGCRHITMVDIDTLNDLRPLYERRGYTLTEKSYVKEL